MVLIIFWFNGKVLKIIFKVSEGWGGVQHREIRTWLMFLGPSSPVFVDGD